VVFSGPRVNILSRKLVSAREHPALLKQKVDKEVKFGRVLGPIRDRSLRVSSIGLVPKVGSNWGLTHILKEIVLIPT